MRGGGGEGLGPSVLLLVSHIFFLSPSFSLILFFYRKPKPSMRPPAPSSGPPSRPPPSGRPARTRRPPQFWRRHWRGRAEVDEMRGGGGLMCGPSPFSSFPDLVLQSSRGARAPPLLPPSPVRSPPSLPHPPPLCHIRSSSGSPFSLPLSLIAYFCVLVCVSGHAVVVSSQACCVCVCVCVCVWRAFCLWGGLYGARAGL